MSCTAALHRMTLAVAFIAMPTLGLAQTIDRIDGAGTASRSLRPAHDRGPPAAAAGRLPTVGPDAVESSDAGVKGAAPPGLPGYSESSPDGSAILPGWSSTTPPPAFGSMKAPFTTARVAVTKRGQSSRRAQDPVTSYPYRATGKLDVRIGEIWYTCTASLVGPSVLLTAGHCIFDFGEGEAGWADEVWFSPASFSKKLGAAYGRYSAKTLRVPAPYVDGTDSCRYRGTWCSNDLATIVLNPLNGRNAGDVVGWYAYAWNGYSFVRARFLGHVAAGQITQLGYPDAFDDGLQMQRTDAVAWFGEHDGVRTTEIGSAQSNGSSGGPWLVNFGTVPKVSSDADRGSDVAMAIVGVTSWGTVPAGTNRQGSSFFGQNKEYPKESYGGYGAGNIGKLMRDTCTSDPAAC